MTPWALARRHAFDVVIVGLAVWGAVDGWLHPTSWEGLDKGPLWLRAGIAPALALPLLARRRFPFYAALVPFAVATGASFLSAEAVVDTTPNFFTLLVAAFLAGAGPLRETAAAIAIALVAVAAVTLNMQSTSEVGDFLFPGAFLAILCVLGALHWEREERARREVDAARRSEQEARIAAVEERSRIARELHDVLAHSVSVMTVQASGVRRRLLPEQEREREALEAVEETGRQALAEMRRLLAAMREEHEVASRAPAPGVAALPALVEQRRRTGVPVELVVEGTPVKLPTAVDLSAYRIVQDALARDEASRAWVSVRYGDDDVEIEVAHEDGGANGNGLTGVRERVALCGGELVSGPRPEGGYRIAARLPVKERP